MSTASRYRVRFGQVHTPRLAGVSQSSGKGRLLALFVLARDRRASPTISGHESP